jgi:hypothetical protein
MVLPKAVHVSKTGGEKEESSLALKRAMPTVGAAFVWLCRRAGHGNIWSQMAIRYRDCLKPYHGYASDCAGQKVKAQMVQFVANMEQIWVTCVQVDCCDHPSHA